MALDAARVQKSIRRLDKFLKKAPKDPPPEKIHDVRTSTRRLESALGTLQIGKKGPVQKLQRDLPQVRKRCGKVRDMDVLTAHAMSVSPGDGEQECLVQLLEHLGANRARYAKRLRKTVKEYGPPLRKDLKPIAKKVDKVASSSRQNGNAQSDGRDASALMDLAADLHSPVHLDKNNLHPYRLKVKELRYVLQLSQEAQEDEFVKTLGEVKDAIGEWHDWEELVAIATEVVTHGPTCKLLRQLKKIASEKFDRALAITNKMRSAYVNGKGAAGRPPKGKTVPFPIAMAQTAARG